MSAENRDWERGEEPTRQMPADAQRPAGGRGERPRGMSSGRKWAIGFVAAVALGLLVALVVLAADEGGGGNGSDAPPATLETGATTQDSTRDTTTAETTETTTSDTSTTNTTTTDTTTTGTETDTDGGSGGVSPP